MPTPSIARSYFDRFLAIPDAEKFSHLAGLIHQTPPYTFEEEWLEFKSEANGANVNQNKDGTLRIWSKTVSALANTGGGVIIWGIFADEDRMQKIDYAHSLRLVTNPSRLRSLLAEHQHTITDPPVSGIELQEVTGPAGEGFVVCYVPEGSGKPHRCERETNKPFYMRAGCHNQVIPTAMLRSMFHPTPQVLLRVEVGVRYNQANGAAEFEGRIRNIGSRSLENVFVLIEPQADVDISPGEDCCSLDPTGIDGTGIDFERPLHRGRVRRCFIAHRRTRSDEPVTFSLIVYSKDNPEMRFEGIFTKQQIEGHGVVRLEQQG